MLIIYKKDVSLGMKVTQLNEQIFTQILRKFVNIIRACFSVELMNEMKWKGKYGWFAVDALKKRGIVECDFYVCEVC